MIQGKIWSFYHPEHKILARVVEGKRRHALERLQLDDPIWADPEVVHTACEGTSSSFAWFLSDPDTYIMVLGPRDWVLPSEQTKFPAYGLP